VYLPEGDWVDYWSGKQISGRQTIAVDAPLDRIPLYVRSGAILAKIPEDVMTLVPASDYADKQVKSIDNRRVYEIYPPSKGGKLESIQDFEGRVIEEGGEPGSLTITGPPAHVILRWRFGGPRTVTVNGRAVPALRTADGVSIEFDHADKTALLWR
jgi:alpha-D-xyloside xylohydrolase